MKISTFNVQNNYRSYKEDKSKDICDYLMNNEIDILGLQEVFSKCDKDLSNYLSKLYDMVGKYRFLSKILLRRINEKTPIITKYKIISHKTYRLPHFPSLLNRVLTHIIIEYNGREISVYNTHLEYKLLYVKKRQLKRILDIISDDHRPLILMGDFNLKDNNQVFNDFVDDLNNMNIKRINLGEKTLKLSKYSREIDHIFVSDSFHVNSKEVIKDLDISDHYPVLVDIDLD